MTVSGTAVWHRLTRCAHTLPYLTHTQTHTLSLWKRLTLTEGTSHAGSETWNTYIILWSKHTVQEDVHHTPTHFISSSAPLCLLFHSVWLHLSLPLDPSPSSVGQWRRLVKREEEKAVIRPFSDSAPCERPSSFDTQETADERRRPAHMLADVGPSVFMSLRGTHVCCTSPAGHSCHYLRRGNNRSVCFYLLSSAGDWLKALCGLSNGILNRC